MDKAALGRRGRLHLVTPVSVSHTLMGAGTRWEVLKYVMLTVTPLGDSY